MMLWTLCLRRHRRRRSRGLFVRGVVLTASDLHSSRLYQHDSWSADVDEFCSLYDAEITAILDRLLPVCSSTRRRRPMDPWFDAECCAAKGSTRKLERAFSAVCRRCRSSRSSSADAVAAPRQLGMHNAGIIVNCPAKSARIWIFGLQLSTRIAVIRAVSGRRSIAFWVVPNRRLVLHSMSTYSANFSRRKS